MNRYLFIVVSTLVLVGCETDNRNIPFDSIRWKNSDSTKRYRMNQDLFENHQQKIMGRNKQDVISLLGQPDLDSVRYSSSKNLTMIYDISDSTYSECPCNLDIVYDSNGIVTEMSSRDI